MVIKLSKRQIDVLHFIQKHIIDKGYPPTIREIANGLGLSSASTVHRHLEILEKSGAIVRDPTKPRAIEIVEHIDLHHVKVSIRVKAISIIGSKKLSELEQSGITITELGR